MNNRKRPRQTERQIQCDVVHFLRCQSPRVLFSATVGGVPCSQVSRGRMVTSGYEKGIPDLIIYEPRGGFHGLCIEFKSKAGRLSTHQNEWLAHLSMRGYYTAVERDATTAIRLIKDYLHESVFLYQQTQAASERPEEATSAASETHPETQDPDLQSGEPMECTSADRCEPPVVL